MEPDVKLHSLIDLSGSQTAIREVLDNIDDDFLWLDEILTECKKTFSSTQVHLLPKTPSQRRPPRKRAKHYQTENDLETIAESTNAVNSQPASSTSETPVRYLRSTRSRTAHMSVSTVVTSKTRAGSKNTEIGNDVEEASKNHNKMVKISLSNVSECEKPALSSPQNLLSVSSPNSCEKDKKTSAVNLRARAYEVMLSERNQKNNTTPKSVSKETSKAAGKETLKNTDNKNGPVCSEIKPAGSETTKPEIMNIDTSQNSQKESANSQRSSVGRKRSSLKVLGSKARMRSLQGRLSSKGHCSTLRSLTGEDLESRAEDQKVEQGDLPAEQGMGQVEDSKKEPVQKNTDVIEESPKRPRARLRLKKGNKTAMDGPSTESSNPSESSFTEDCKASLPEDKKSSPICSPAGTKCRKLKSQSSDNEHDPSQTDKTGIPASRDDMDKVRTRTKVRKKKSVESNDNDEGKSQTQATLTDDDSSQTKVSGSVSSTGSEIEGRPQTRAHAKVRKLETKEISSEEAVDTESTNGSVFESPVPDKNCQQRSPYKLSNDLSEKSLSSRVSGDSGVCSIVTRSVTDETRENIISKKLMTTSESNSVSVMVCDIKMKNSEELSRRETHVISKPGQCPAEDEGKFTATETRQQNNTRDSVSSVKSPPGEEPRMTRTKARKRQAEEEAADTSASAKRSHQMSIEEPMEVDNDSDYEDIEPDNTPKVQKKVPSFLNQLRKSSLSRSISLAPGVTSFLQKNTPQQKSTFQHLQAQKKKELLEKQKREQDRLNQLDVMRKNKADELKRKRDERMLRVAAMREMRQKKEQEMKKTLAEKLKERLDSRDKMKEDKYREEREKQKIRLKRQLEADARRRQEEEQRMQKLLEQQEEQKRHEELLQHRKEQEEHERQRRQAEERKRQEERQAEVDRQRQAEKERTLQQELEREKELQKEREQREKQWAQERAERERQELEKRKEREQKIQRELEKLKELEQQRLAKMAAQEEEKRREEIRLQRIIQQHNRNLENLGFTSTLTLTTNTNSLTAAVAAKTTAQTESNSDSYVITPVRPKKNGSLENYDITDLKSDESTDDDEAPRKKIPSWAQGANLKANLINQVYHPPDLDALFSYIEPPDLNELFDRKRARFNKRTSSAVWNSPINKSH